MQWKRNVLVLPGFQKNHGDISKKKNIFLFQTIILLLLSVDLLVNYFELQILGIFFFKDI